jgi:hypothetical protein
MIALPIESGQESAQAQLQRVFAEAILFDDAPFRRRSARHPAPPTPAASASIATTSSPA